MAGATSTKTETSMMNTFVMKRIGEVGLMEKPVPTPGPNDAILRTTAALVCTSDAHTVGGAIGERENLTLGHEAVGVVHQVGSAVTSVKPGQRVVVGAITPCYKCDNCQRGYTSQCTQMLGGWKFANVKDGVFADYFHVNDADANLAIIPDDLSDEAACYTVDMMSTGFMGAELADIPLGGSAAVIGCGPVGLMAIAGAKLLGAARIFAVDTVPARLELAKFYGADEVVDFKAVDPVEAIKGMTGGEGVDSAIEALGSEKTFGDCVRVTRAGGTISNTGYHGEGDFVGIPRLDWGVGMADKTIKGGLCPGGRERLTRLMRLIQSGRVDPTKLTTHRIPFAEVDRAYDIMANKKDGVIKPLVVFDH